jgi:hypothetical protein
MSALTTDINGFLALAAAVIATGAAVAAYLFTRNASGIAADAYSLLEELYLSRRLSVVGDLSINGTTVTALRAAKEAAKAHRRSDSAGWARDATTLGTWQNKFCYELSIALERLGAAVFTGVVPSRLVLCVASDQLIEDWLLLSDFIEAHRRRPGGATRELRGEKLDYHRRHAEWLALLAGLWMRCNFPAYPGLGQLEQKLGGGTRLRAKLTALTNADRTNMHAATRSHFNELRMSEFLE